MGIVVKLATSADQAAEEHWGPMLARQNLRPEDIAGMNDEQVDRQLTWVDQAAADPSRFGSMAYAVIDERGSDLASVDIRPALYRRKSLLLDRREELRAEALKRQTDGAGDDVGSEEIRAIATQWAVFIEETRRDRQGLQEDRDNLQRDMARAASARADAALKSQLRQSWWSRESVAGTLGAGLLALFGLCIALGMWFRHDPPQLMGNAFLLVLGYFFGQGAAERRSRHLENEDAES